MTDTGTDLHYESHGPEGAPVLILSSGLGGAGGYWAPNLAALSENHRVLTYDQRGTGRSDRALPETTSIEAMAQDVTALMDALGIESAHFIGHALGGMIGIEAALLSGRIDRLVVVNGWRSLSPHTRRCFEARLAILRGAGVEAFLRAQPLFLFPPDWIASHDAELEAEFAHHLAGFPGAETMEKRIAAVRAYAPSAERLAKLRDVLVIATRDDFLVPHAASLDLAEPIPGADVATFEWGGHACNVTDPAGFNRLVLGFLGS
ncbi:pyrimidine utilization protein D [Novosphingobium sp. P6W]|uniref:pyrimidine utilization protein D n=1 Tax=Novosphingobium sp. P6W TaxID=1609758 RepID=UPI0005C2D26E|nr:pyrimidine utilization protein D [Novosphingobium sp. P6W]AXB77537.1 pyrimidine utilization protein D [Novosphingobium sp. P6W]KIS33901.1 aminoacrylate hydrolase [Novosphingobium sp. P6W]